MTQPLGGAGGIPANVCLSLLHSQIWHQRKQRSSAICYWVWFLFVKVRTSYNLIVPRQTGYNKLVQRVRDLVEINSIVHRAKLKRNAILNIKNECKHQMLAKKAADIGGKDYKHAKYIHWSFWWSWNRITTNTKGAIKFDKHSNLMIRNSSNELFLKTHFDSFKSSEIGSHRHLFTTKTKN